MTLLELLTTMVERGAESLHLVVNAPPMLRVLGALIPVDDPPLTIPEVEALAAEVRPLIRAYGLPSGAESRDEGTRSGTLWVKDVARFSFEIFQERGVPAAVFKQIPYEILAFKELGIPAIVETLCDRPGLVLVGGPPRSGRSTLIATLTDKVNREQPGRILIVEPRVGVLHTHKRSVVSQVGLEEGDCSVGEVMRVALRGDFDTVVFDGLLGREERELALRLALSGQLVISSAYGRTCTAILTGFLAEFPPHEQPGARNRLAASLSAVVAMQLLTKATGKGRCAALEVLPVTPAVRELVLKDQLAGIDRLLKASESNVTPGKEPGIQSMNAALRTLVSRRVVSAGLALQVSPDPDGLRAFLGTDANPAILTSATRRP